MSMNERGGAAEHRTARHLMLSVLSMFLVILAGACAGPARIDIILPAAAAAAPLAHPLAPTPEPASARQTSVPRARTTPRVTAQLAQIAQVKLPPAATEPPTRIVATRIGLDAPVKTISWARNASTGLLEWQTADYAAGYHAGSALPGAQGNTVISGHHNIKGKVFARLSELQPKDEVDLYVGAQVYRYQVSDTLIVPERGVSEAQRLQNARWIAPTTDVRLTLVTCWPANDNSHRVIVVALPMDTAAGEASASLAAGK